MRTGMSPKYQAMSLLQVLVLYQLPQSSADYYQWYRPHHYVHRPVYTHQQPIQSMFQQPVQSLFQQPMSLNNLCSLQRPSDLLRMLPGRFLSDEDLRNVVAEPNIISVDHKPTYTALRRVVVGTLSASSPIKTGKVDYTNDGLCGCCLTEIGYDVIEEVTDFQGRNHTLINFNNNYQFIPTGKCSNEDAPCGGGGRARCKQVTRAHWSLVWTPGEGVQLVAHEVPSHCQCLNIGSNARTNTTLG